MLVIYTRKAVNKQRKTKRKLGIFLNTRSECIRSCSFFLTININFLICILYQLLLDFKLIYLQKIINHIYCFFFIPLIIFVSSPLLLSFVVLSQLQQTSLIPLAFKPVLPSFVLYSLYNIIAELAMKRYKRSHNVLYLYRHLFHEL